MRGNSGDLEQLLDFASAEAELCSVDLSRGGKPVGAFGKPLVHGRRMQSSDSPAPAGVNGAGEGVTAASLTT